MPGAASVRAANYIWSVADQDGTVLAIPNHALPLNAILWREMGEGFDVAKFNWIGRLDAIDVVALVWHTVNIKASKMRSDAKWSWRARPSGGAP